MRNSFLKPDAPMNDTAQEQPKEQPQESDSEELLGLRIARERRQQGGSVLNTRTDDFVENTRADYVSPFSDEYQANIAEVEKEDAPMTAEEAEENAIVDGRIKFYLTVMAATYLVFLCYGWYVTSFTGDTPSLITFEERDRRAYLARIDEHIMSLQNLRAEAMENLSQLEQKTVGKEETTVRMQKVTEKLQKTKEEIKDIVPPASLDGFQIRLDELYSVLMAYSSAVENYARAPTEKNRRELEDADEKYEIMSAKFLAEYDQLFSKS